MTVKTRDLCRLSEEDARKHLEQMRWPDGPVCVHCGSTNAVTLEGNAHRAGVEKCRDCRKQFTVTIGTVMERSHLPLAYWLYAFARMCASKKGISAKQLERELGISYKAAWFMCHRIRHSMTPVHPAMLTGIVEADETYVGGKPRKGNGKVHKRGRGTAKIPVAAVVQRDGNVRTRTVADVTHKTLKNIITECIEPASTLYTDDLSSSKGMDEYVYKHESVNHSEGQYAREDGIHSNTVESCFALLKRDVYGTYHRLSKKHLHRYCDEFSFRWDYRKNTDWERTLEALKRTEGKRLVFHSIIAKEDSTNASQQKETQAEW